MALTLGCFLWARLICISVGVQALCARTLCKLVSLTVCALRCSLVDVEVQPQLALGALNDLSSLSGNLRQSSPRSED